MSKVLSLKERYQDDIKREKDVVLNLNNGSLNLFSLCSDLWFINEVKGLYEYQANRNLQNAKQGFYLCGRIDEFLIKYSEIDVLSWALKHFGYVLLSDCESLIDSYANLTQPAFEPLKKKGHFVYCIQCVINEDWNELKVQLEKLEKQSSAKRNLWMKADLKVFKGFLENDINLIKSGIVDLVSPKLHRKHNGFFVIQRQYLSFPAITYTKLAWLKGYKVKVDSPLLPTELLEVKPNTEYIDTYDFLKEIEGGVRPPKDRQRIEPFEYGKPNPKVNDIINYQNTLLSVKESDTGRENLSDEEKKLLAEKIWLAYLDPKTFDKKYPNSGKEYAIEEARREGGIIYVYEYPMWHQWHLVDSEKAHFLNVMGMIIEEEIHHDEYDDWYVKSTMAKLFEENEQKGVSKEASR